MEEILLLLKNKGLLTDYDISTLSENKEHKAKEIVSRMFHIDKGKKYIGEYFNIDKVKQICKDYLVFLPINICYADFYIMLNYYYHNHINLYNKWELSDIDTKIIEAAICYWCKDDDWDYEHKFHTIFNI